MLLSFAHCNSCPTCLAGHPGYCYKFMDLNFGGHRQDGSATTTLTTADGTEKPMFSAFFGQSSFSRLAAVHRSSVVRVPADTPLDLFAPLGCGIQTGFGAVQNALKVTPGSSVAIFGVGSVGMAAVMGAKACGATTIIAVDLQAERLELAKELGATHGLLGNVGREKLIEEIQAICPPFGVDFAVDCSGVPAVIETMVAALGMMGCAATVGAPEVTKNASINIMDHLTHGRSYIGCTEGDSVPSKVGLFACSRLLYSAARASLTSATVHPLPDRAAQERSTAAGEDRAVLRRLGLRAGTSRYAQWQNHQGGSAVGVMALQGIEISNVIMKLVTQ